MPTPFAGIETSINAATTAALANATLTWGASSTADGVFRNPAAGLLGELVQGSQPSFTGLASAVGSIALGAAVAIGAVNYTVVRREPDGAGLTRLTLQTA